MILNVGCGHQFYGDERIDIMPTEATTKICDITKNIPFPDNYFDEVYCAYVFEHMADPFKLLQEMRRVCKPDGTIKVITDNAGYIFTHIEKRGLHGNYSDSAVHGLKYNKKDFHFMLFTPEHLRNFALAADLKPVNYGFMFWEEVTSKKSIFIHKFLKMFLGKRFIMPSVYLIAKKPEND